MAPGDIDPAPSRTPRSDSAATRRRRAARPVGAGARLRVSICDAHGRPRQTPGLAAWLARVAPPRARGDVTVALVSDARMRVLNRTWRGVDHATDVLSFPAGEDAPGHPHKTRKVAPPHLGDIVIATGVAARQAREAGHAEATEWRVLALHGLLHLLGYDHERDAGTMARVESRLRRRGGLGAGLIERAPRLPAPSRPERRA